VIKLLGLSEWLCIFIRVFYYAIMVLSYRTY
jgi:hypothetical protein